MHSILKKTVKDQYDILCFVLHTSLILWIRPVSLIELFYSTAKPEVMEFDKLRSKVEGETAVIECNVTGYPIPEITWYRQLEDTGTLLLLLLLHLYVRTCIFERFDVD